MQVDRTEKIFIIGSIIMVAIFALAIAISGIAFGIQVPAPYQQVDPNTIATPGNSPFGAPVDERVREISEGKWEAYILAQTWVFQPNEVRIPAGSELTFYVTSKDVQHGFDNIPATLLRLFTGANTGALTFELGQGSAGAMDLGTASFTDVSVAIAGDGKEGSVHVTPVIVDHRGTCAGRQGALRAPQAIVAAIERNRVREARDPHLDGRLVDVRCQANRDADRSTQSDASEVQASHCPDS